MAKVTPSALNPTGEDEHEIQEDAVLEAQQLLQMLDPLLENPHFQAFWTRFGEGVKAQGQLALDVSLKKKKRERAVHIHHALKHWYNWPMAARAAAIRQIGLADKLASQEAEIPSPPSL